MASHKTRRAVMLGAPVLVVAALTIVALWRVGAPVRPAPGTTAPAATAGARPPLTSIADLLAPDAVGRQASLESVRIREVPSVRTLWVGDDQPLFAVLDPDVKRSHEARLVPGARVTLVGLVRRPPAADAAVRQWRVDAATARTVEERGAYLYVTEVRPGI